MSLPVLIAREKTLFNRRRGGLGQNRRYWNAVIVLIYHQFFPYGLITPEAVKCVTIPCVPE